MPSGPTTQSHADDEDPAALQVRSLRALDVAEDPLDVGAPAVGLDPGVRAPGQRLANLRHDGTRDGDGAMAVSGSARRHHHVTPPMTKSSFDGLADPGSIFPIFLELGQSGGAHPADPASVQSLLSRALQSATDVAEFDDLRPFTVSVLPPGRTLIEKLLRMNNFSQASDSERDTKGWSRIGRQFYDVWALLGHSSVVGFLQDTKTVRAVLADCAVVSQSFGQDAPPPADGCAASRSPLSCHYGNWWGNGRGICRRHLRHAYDGHIKGCLASKFLVHDTPENYIRSRPAAARTDRAKPTASRSRSVSTRSTSPSPRGSAVRSTSSNSGSSAAS